MQDKSVYSTGEFAKRANVSIRTIRYYDKIGLLKPANIKESGYRYYTDQDFAKLQKILVLKRLGFSLEEIKNFSEKDKNVDYIKDSFELQIKLIHEKITELKQIEQIIQETSLIINENPEPDWNRMTRFIHLLSMEETLLKQYKNSSNINARIDLHKKYSMNSFGWFPWIYQNLSIQPGLKILELGCGNGQLWKENIRILPDDVQIILSDISSGMVRSAKSMVKEREKLFTFHCFDMQDIPYDDDTFDLVIANHVLFYAKDLSKTLKEIKRVLKPDGGFTCSTYGKNHMKEIELLAKEYDDRIALSEVKLYDIFGLDMGAMELSSIFSKVEKRMYEDYLVVTEVKPFADYIYSCHGNQMDYLAGQQDKFEKFISNKIGKKGLQVTKDAGIFYCRKG